MNKSSSKNMLKQAIRGTKEALLMESQIEMTGNTHAVIQGAKGIISYEEDSIRIKLLDQEIQFFGSKLTIDCLSQDSMEIRGKIIRIEYLT